MAVKFEDYYHTLGVERGATQDQIKRAYRKLAQKWHPDRNKAPEAAGRFSKVTEAYEVLGDADKRKKYDQFGADYKEGQDFRPPPGFEGFQTRHPGGGGTGGFTFEGEGFSDFFEALFGRRAAAMRQGPGGPGGPGAAGGPGGPGGVRMEDLFGGNGGYTQAGRPAEQESEITVSLEEAHAGTTRRLELQGPQGRKTLDVKVPAGTRPGQKVRLRGEGLVLKINLAPHPRFELSGGADLTTDLKITASEAALGAKADVQTLDAAVTLTIPPGSQSGSKLRLRGKGLSDKGDLYVRLMIAVPKDLTDEQRQLFEQLRDTGFNPRA